MSRAKKQPFDKGERADLFKIKCQCIIRKDAAKFLGITPQALDHLLRTGILTFKRCLIGKRLQGYSLGEIIDFLRILKIVKKNGKYSIVPNTFKIYKLF